MASLVCDISISLIKRLHRIDWNLVFNKCENRNKSAKLIATIEGLIWQIDFRKSHTHKFVGKKDEIFVVLKEVRLLILFFLFFTKTNGNRETLSKERNEPSTRTFFALLPSQLLFREDGKKNTPLINRRQDSRYLIIIL